MILLYAKTASHAIQEVSQAFLIPSTIGEKDSHLPVLGFVSRDSPVATVLLTASTSSMSSTPTRFEGIVDSPMTN